MKYVIDTLKSLVQDINFPHITPKGKNLASLIL
jgi:hypothetical protein